MKLGYLTRFAAQPSIGTEYKELPLYLFALVGVIVVLLAGAQLLRFLYRHLLQRPSRLADKFRGDWAFITGASYGVGAGFARECARRGLNLVLLARSAEKLAAVAAECEQHGVAVRVVAFDLAQASEAEWNELYEGICDLEVSVLINNAGVNLEFPTEFIDMDEAAIERIVRVNICAMNKITRRLLPKMIERKKGCLIFLSSAGGAVVPCPLLSVYGGTKAYIDAFAVALSGEVRRHKIAVLSLTPFWITSEMSKIRRANWMVPSADAFARLALDRLGLELRSNPHWAHELIALGLKATRSLPAQVAYVERLHRRIRERALRKLKRQQ
jgi:17beta-estradiol 17-dehydrogenase / very-long-chain 3-oxoacyl-CoA reductase